MALTLTPEQEQRLTVYAQKQHKPAERVLDEWIETLPQEPASEPQTWGAKKLAELQAKGALGAFKDRPEDSITLARKFQALAEGHSGEEVSAE